MVAILLLSVTFLVIMLMACLGFIINTRNWIVNRDKETMKKFNEITDMVKENNKMLIAHTNKMLANVDKLIQ